MPQFCTDAKGKVWTATGVSLNRAYVAMGAGSAYFSGTTCNLSTPNSADFAFGTGDFTVETWFRRDNMTGQVTLAGSYGSSVTGWSVSIISSKFIFGAVGDGIDIQTTTTLVAGTWYYGSISRISGVFYIHLNGVMEASVANTSDITCPGLMMIGNLPGATSYGVLGYLDDMRITKGVGRYGVSNYTVPALAHPENDVDDPSWASVVSLNHWDEHVPNVNPLVGPMLPAETLTELVDGTTFTLIPPGAYVPLVGPMLPAESLTELVDGTTFTLIPPGPYVPLVGPMIPAESLTELVDTKTFTQGDQAFFTPLVSPPSDAAVGGGGGGGGSGGTRITGFVA